MPRLPEQEQPHQQQARHHQLGPEPKRRAEVPLTRSYKTRSILTDTEG